jgi:hypothetical protein
MVMALAARKITVREMLRAWGIVYAGNFVGAFGTAVLVVLSGQYLSAKGQVAEAALSLAIAGEVLAQLGHEMMPVGTPPSAATARLPWRSSRRQLATALGALGLLGAGYTAAAFYRALAAARRRVSSRSELVQTRFGVVEYAIEGRGPALLMIHGTGGGFDQGLSFSASLLRRGVRVVTPSRFGYSRNDFPEDPFSENQAEAAGPAGQCRRGEYSDGGCR